MFTQLTDDNYAATFASTQEGICIFYKKLCPHCANMEKVLQKISTKIPAITLMSIDMEENPNSATACKAERAPTLVIIKNGTVVANKNGLMNPKEMIAFYQSC